jgi:hypothetical protein
MTAAESFWNAGAAAGASLVLPAPAVLQLWYKICLAIRINPFPGVMNKTILTTIPGGRTFSRLSSAASAAVLTFFVLIFTLPACHSGAGGTATATDGVNSSHSGSAAFKPNPEFRTHVKKEPVAEYRVRTDDSLNDFYFSVRLYETPVTMKYQAKLEFETITGDETIELPEMGTVPTPVLKKGPEKYSCIIGMLDNNKEFRELKKVYVTDKGNLKVITLKRYTVTGE